MYVDLPTLRYLVVAADHRSFRRAAVSLNITQPTLSKRIRELEDWLGVRLFERSTSGADLTSIGEEVVISARRILAELRAMETRARAGKVGDAGRLEIGFYTSLSKGALRDTLLAFIRKYPDVDINIAECSRESLVPLLDRGAIDIVVTFGDSAHADYAHIGLWSERVMVALPKAHPLAARDFLYWTDIKNECFLMSQRDPGPEQRDVLLILLSHKVAADTRSDSDNREIQASADGG